MKPLLNSNKPKGTKYKYLWVRLLTSLAAAQIIVTIGQKRNYLELLFIPAYYNAFIFSFIIAFVLLEMIFQLTVLLDQKISWDHHPVLRFCVQIVMGVFLLWVLAYLLAAGYYRLHHIDISETGYSNYLFSLIQLYVVAMNVCCNWKFVSGLVQKIDKGGAKLTAEKHIGDKVALKEKDIALIIRDGWAVVARNSADAHVEWEHGTIAGSMKVVPLTLYIQARSSCIVRGDLIESVVQTDRKLILTIKGPFKKKIIVPKGKIPAFKTFGEKHRMAWWDADKKRFR